MSNVARSIFVNGHPSDAFRTRGVVAENLGVVDGKLMFNFRPTSGEEVQITAQNPTVSEQNAVFVSYSNDSIIELRNSQLNYSITPYRELIQQGFQSLNAVLQNDMNGGVNPDQVQDSRLNQSDSADQPQIVSQPAVLQPSSHATSLLPSRPGTLRGGATEGVRSCPSTTTRPDGERSISQGR